ncbi:MAG TPA: carotenoid biosynthesis protein [Candidatus Dojkabacteria bacterium]|nr:carotenoid biosynthesis protein [Candidatus Dojkabacteria bacterium]HRO65080.1 carotenoid biosynthesis protein [Candidatus Dojkabacteria bacterium]HRP51690.1 carotenoid biosynthesis protein [Candidatus Dojkabacteria bacterium]
MKIPLKEFVAVIIVNMISAFVIFLTRDSSIFPIMLQIVLLILGFVGFYLLYRSTNIKVSLAIFILLGIYGLIIETTSIKTGFPYSRFQYSDMMGYKLYSIVPYTVFLIWPTLVISAYSLSEFIAKKRFYRIIVTTILLLSLDLVFDPVATGLGFWKWEQTGLYYGVPFLNFLGWIFSSLISSIIVFQLLQKFSIGNKYLVLIYLGNLILWTFLSILMGMFIPLIISFLIFLILFKKFHLIK